MQSITQTIATELGVSAAQVSAATTLLDQGASVPFIARYRKEATKGLDDTQLRNLSQRLSYLRELDERRSSIIKQIQEQSKLSEPLRSAIMQAETKTRLEDLYLPYKPKRKTKGQQAIAAGLEPLAERLLDDPMLSPEQEAKAFINPEHKIEQVKDALDGARCILMERFAEDADLLLKLRNQLWQNGIVHTSLIEGKADSGAKFRDYFDYQEPIKQIPSHRALALFRGRSEDILTVKLSLPEESLNPASLIASHFAIRHQQRPADDWLQQVVSWCWKVKLSLHLETELLGRLKTAAEAEAIQVFSRNLHDLLLAAPAGTRVTMGLDPGIRTGVKVAVVDSTGKLLDTATIYPHAPRHQWQESLSTLAKLCKKHKVELISIGNGTASRETDKLVADLLQQQPELHLNKIMVSEAGASVYSASEFAAQEFPELDVSLRGAVSIARRLQDPLAELVKIEPKAIGVGQYQHDVSQLQLARSLDAVVEDCVNAVGVDLNIASAPLLARVSGLSRVHAQNIVAFRDANGPFANRKGLLKVPRLGAKTFEQCAGFLRVVNGDNPLDRSAVHPEAYPLVKQLLAHTGLKLEQLLGNKQQLQQLHAADFTSKQFGLPTVVDVLQELDKPGRDPRPEFQMASFREGVETLQDLEPGMQLEGVVTNVTNFGAFVDIGVHQDGLVHISALADHFVKDPADVVRAGEIVRVKVLEVDLKRKRIALTMRKDQPSGSTAANPKPQAKAKPAASQSTQRKHGQTTAASNSAMGNAFADALAQLKR